MPNSNSKTYIVNDQPTETDGLDFTPYVETLADIIQTGNTPLTIGVFGGWGSGKTSLMKMLKNKLPQTYTVAWFDAWKYDKEDTLWRAFLLNVLFAMEKTVGAEAEDLQKLKTLLYRGLEFEKTGGVTIDLAKLGAGIAEGAVQIALSFVPPLATLTTLVTELQKGGKANIQGGFENAIQRERAKIYVEQIRSLEQFQDKFRGVVEQHISNNGNRLVVFVDDLDRCLPEKAIQVLEAIKLFLDVKDCVFVLGIDQDVIARGIEMKYKEFKDRKDTDGQPRFTIDGIKYLEKIIQLPFQIPPVIQDDMGKFVEGLSEEWPHEECHRVFAEGLGDNPRNIKRTVNTFLMLSKLAEKRKEKLKESVKPIRLAKVVAIQAVHPDLFNLLLKEEPRYLRELEEYYFSEVFVPYKNQEGKETEFGEIQKQEPPPALIPFLSQRGIAAVRRILTMKHRSDTPDANFAGLPTDELKLYFTLTRSAEAPQAVPPPAEVARLVFEPQMVRIPAGEFLMGSIDEQETLFTLVDGPEKDWIAWEKPQHIVYIPEYSIGKYPITNREYQAFIRDAKHQPPKGWDGDQFPTDKGSHPVVNVSWNDAMDYCKWLNEKTHGQYRLPTEAEWEKAARGIDGRIWPWGNDFNPNMANTKEASRNDTTEVGQFSPQGDSPYGCADMIGNIWEWTSSIHKDYPYNANDGREDLKSEELRIVRGGSFYRDYQYARCAIRRSNNSRKTGEAKGFRVANSPTKN